MAIAKTLQNILEHQLVSTSLDRSKPINNVIEQVLDYWRADLSNRKPAPAYITNEDGERIYTGTDFDMFTFLMTLSQRRAVINLPEYERLRKQSLRSNQYVISRVNRHGQVFRLTSNSQTHAFSVLIKDFNVVETDKNGKENVGAPRNFALVDDFGVLYDGWKNFEWHATKEEEEFLNEHNIESFSDKIEFEHFSHPALAFSFYGSPYLATKTLAVRMQDEASHYRQLAKKLIDEGIKLQLTKKEEVEYWEEGKTKQIKVRNLEAKLVLPDFKGEYPIYGMSESDLFKEKPEIKFYEEMPKFTKYKKDVLRYSLWRSKKLSYSLGPRIRVPARAVELAFYLYGFSKNEVEKKPGWEIPEWIKNYREKGKKIEWNMLELNKYVQLLYRIRETSARIQI